MKKRTTPDVVAHRVVTDYFTNEAANIHKIVERDAAGFHRLLEAISGTPHKTYRSRMMELNEAIRNTLPDLAGQISDAHIGELSDYLEAGFLIGLSVGRREAAR